MAFVSDVYTVEIKNEKNEWEEVTVIKEEQLKIVKNNLWIETFEFKLDPSEISSIDSKERQEICLKTLEIDEKSEKPKAYICYRVKDWTIYRNRNVVAAVRPNETVKYERIPIEE